MAADNLMKKTIENEACLVISTGWTKMYPTLNDRNTLLINLLTEGKVVLDFFLDKIAIFQYLIYKILKTPFINYC